MNTSATNIDRLIGRLPIMERPMPKAERYRRRVGRNPTHQGDGHGKRAELATSYQPVNDRHTTQGSGELPGIARKQSLV
jgi:hypothetical protein